MSRKLQNWLPVIDGTKRGLGASIERLLLGVMTPFYRSVVAVRNQAFKRGWKKVFRSDVPVISIGNLTTGGTGKTPLVIWLASLLREKGVRVAILSRGYKSSGSNANDETREVGRKLPDVPVLENRYRIESARIAVEELEMEALILDDGFQHRQLHRDLNIVVVDATNPFGFSRLLPRGLLREPLSSLSRADFVVITRANIVDEKTVRAISQRLSRHVAPEKIAVAGVFATHWIQAGGQTLETELLHNTPLLGFCGIGNPNGFFRLLESSGFSLAGRMTFPDHHHYNDVELAEIATAARDKGASAIVCTVKDIVKIPKNRLEQFPLYALETEFRFLSGREHLEAVTDKVIAAGEQKRDD